MFKAEQTSSERHLKKTFRISLVCSQTTYTVAPKYIAIIWSKYAKITYFFNCYFIT